MAYNPDEPKKPSDKTTFYFQVFQASNTVLEFEQYLEFYMELLDILWFNNDIDGELVRQHGYPDA